MVKEQSRKSKVLSAVGIGKGRGVDGGKLQEGDTGLDVEG